MSYTTFFDAFHFLNDHPIFKGQFQTSCLDVQVVKVNPLTKAIDDDETFNTETNVWLECGPQESDDFSTHDYDLDCGGNTYEEAIIKLAALVLKEYGNYEIPQPTEEELTECKAFIDSIKRISESK